MRILDLHPWDIAPAEARAIQTRLAERVVLEDAVALDEVRTVVGIDNFYVKGEAGTVAYAAVVVLSFPALEPIETAVATRSVAFPYVLGLLSFREAPPSGRAPATLRSSAPPATSSRWRVPSRSPSPAAAAAPSCRCRAASPTTP